MADSVTVAASGWIDRDDKCPSCGAGLFFRVKREGTKEHVIGTFCGRVGCPNAFKEEAARG